MNRQAKYMVFHKELLKIEKELSQLQDESDDKEVSLAIRDAILKVLDANIRSCELAEIK